MSTVARRQDLSPGQLITWQRQSRKQPPMFVPR
nr:hypothetical protein [Rhizobium phaseoli]